MMFAVVTLVHLADTKEELDSDTDAHHRGLAVLMPFKAQEVRDQGGVYYGQNVISKNLIIANRKELLNCTASVYHSCIKSF